jgi:hypothetical protein
MGVGKPAPIIFRSFQSVKIPPLPSGCAALAQLVEHLTRNEKVWGSIPQGGSKRSFCIIKSHSSDLGADCMIHLNHLQLEWQIDFALL